MQHESKQVPGSDSSSRVERLVVLLVLERPGECSRAELDVSSCATSTGRRSGVL
jgi:hypothetical protein